MKDIISKIKKLLNLSNSSNENESETALLKAQELLVKHKLSLKEVEQFDDSNSKVITQKTDITFRSAKWKGQLANLIADNFRCYNYYNTRYTNGIVLLGKEEDVKIAEIVLSYAIDSVESTCKRLAYRYRKQGYSTRGLTNDYALGFIEGLRNKFEEQKAKNQEWGIILAKDIELKNSYENINFTGSVNITSRLKGFSEAYHTGIEDGNNFDITTRVENKTKEKELIG
ncbi:protein of unknown function DUF2786 [Gottschalkia purinilytica]|uniref:Uncharacterized protein n=1 Tax=Gottschalkia purinilytica TaxID=1503 RepID=A0A0L0WAJ3_GOTPU|nr:DUF2786 domain-containing protein [Gottschalkia purinilytica]KNF08534.1 protein of unknown function DUF2786 [Gottschalkia purinilytica]